MLMSDECAKLSFPFKTQFNNTVPIVEGLQQHCLLEGAPILTNAASSKDVPATMLTDEHNRAKDGRTYRVHTQLLESKEQKGPEVDFEPPQRICAHEDMGLLCDLQSSFREAVRDSKSPCHKHAAALPAKCCSRVVSGLLSSPRNPMASSKLQSSTQSLYQQRTALPKGKRPPVDPIGLPRFQVVGADKGMVRSRSAGGSPDADMTRQLRTMFSKEIKRKQRKTEPYLPKVVEAPMESCLD